MSKLFNQVQFSKPKKTLFNLAHSRKMSMNMGDLVPIMCEEVVPGDKWMGRTEAIIRMAPMLAPIMHRLNVRTEFFFVPNRLVWNEWEDFITGGESGVSVPVMPYIPIKESATHGSLADYLGCATLSSSGSILANINALPFRAYQLIYNEYYRDQDLVDEVDISKASGLDNNAAASLTLRKRAWEKDMFTSARPWTQKGGEVEIPLLGTAPLVKSNDTDPIDMGIISGTTPPASGNLSLGTDHSIRDSSGNILNFENVNMEADMSSVTSATIAELRNAVRLQEWLEKNARGGSRYIESMLVHFGVRSSDARLQRPEYLGGGKVPMMISEVLQTSETSTSPQGNLSGHGVSAGSSPNWSQYFEEHGYIIGIMSVMPETAYYQGFRRHFLKNDKFDYFWSDFENIGEQQIYNAELFHNYSGSANKNAFGYTPRYMEYKYIPNSVHGDFKSTLEYWHMGRKFASLPTLNSDFITADPTARIFAVEGTTHKLWCNVYNDVKAIRPMQRFGNPRL